MSQKNFFLSTPGLFCKGGLVKFLFVFLNYLFISFATCCYDFAIQVMIALKVINFITGLFFCVLRDECQCFYVHHMNRETEAKVSVHPLLNRVDELRTI